MKHAETALIIFGLTALLGFVAACAGIAVALCGRTNAGSILCLAAAGWWLEALIAGRDCR
ncbi:MAG: hypothetical protein LUD84_09680 [Clostridiales bacterium]|nr:hypothetical protein [Clostridiales bacterium]